MLEVVGSDEQSKESNERVGSDGGEGSSADERGEGDVGREDCAEQEGAKDVEHSDSILGPSVRADLSDPS